MAINQKTKALTFIGIASILGLNALSLFQWSAVQGWVSHTLRVKNTLTECLAVMSEMQEGRRGYVFRGDGDFKARYLIAKGRLNRTVQQLKQMTADNAGQSKRCEQLEKKFLDLERAYDEEVVLRETGGMEVAMVQIRATNSNASIQSATRKYAARLQDEENFLLEDRTKKAFMWQMISGIAAATLGLITFVAVACALRLLEREKSMDQLRYEQVMSYQREDFMAALAHNLKIPMLGMQQILTSMLSGNVGEMSKEQKDLLSLIRTTNEEQLVLIKRLLNVYAYQASGRQKKHSDVQIPALVEQSISKFSQRASNQGVQISAKSEGCESTPGKGATFSAILPCR